MCICALVRQGAHLFCHHGHWNTARTSRCLGSHALCSDISVEAGYIKLLYISNRLKLVSNPKGWLCQQKARCWLMETLRSRWEKRNLKIHFQNRWIMKLNGDFDYAHFLSLFGLEWALKGFLQNPSYSAQNPVHAFSSIWIVQTFKTEFQRWVGKWDHNLRNPH